MRAADAPIPDTEADTLFSDLAHEAALVLAISGGPDSTALLHLVARWRGRRDGAPALLAITIDHGLRPEAAEEAADVGRLAASLGIGHRTLCWCGPKPATGLQERARLARYRLLHDAAIAAGAGCVLTAHTLDDQAETLLFRMSRGSGLAGLGGVARSVSLAGLLDLDPAGSAVRLVRPVLDIEKTRLLATLRQAQIPYADDPSNADERFARSRWRKLMPALAAEGLTAARLAKLAARVRRSEEAIEAGLDAAFRRFDPAADPRRIALGAQDLQGMPEEIALRFLGRAIDRMGDEGPVELGKLEVLSAALRTAIATKTMHFRRTLAGASVSLDADLVVIERAPARRRSLPAG